MQQGYTNFKKVTSFQSRVIKKPARRFEKGKSVKQVDLVRNAVKSVFSWRSCVLSVWCTLPYRIEHWSRLPLGLNVCTAWQVPAVVSEPRTREQVDFLTTFPLYNDFFSLQLELILVAALSPVDTRISGRVKC